MTDKKQEKGTTVGISADKLKEKQEEFAKKHGIKKEKQK